MPSTLTYPGVYVEEIASGVRTITGVSTSVTAFAGSAKRGPINSAVRILSLADFERRFGGLQAESELGYAVRQFYLNGGSEAYIIRLAKNPAAASRTLKNESSADVLILTALEEGASGNNIEVRVGYATANPASTFNLVLNYISQDDPSDNRSEAFLDLSMNSADPRYVVDMLRDASQLVKVERVEAAVASVLAVKGTSVSGSLLDVASVLNATHNQFQVVVNGLPPVPVSIALPGDVAGASEADRLSALCTAIQTTVQAAAAGRTALSAFTCLPNGNTIKMTSGSAGEKSSVRVLPGLRNDAAALLKLGTANGGIETDACAALRPTAIPAPATLTSNAFATGDLDALPSSAKFQFQISLDNYGPDLVSLNPTPPSGTSIAQKLQSLAAAIEGSVRALKPSNPAYQGFSVSVNVVDSTLVLSSGTRGIGSSVQVTPAGANSIANELHLLNVGTRPVNVTLEGGSETPYTTADEYNLYIADRGTRKGIYALESVDIFNLMCLPGVTDSGILADAAAYCRERRAFLIVDAPRTAATPDQMVAIARGAGLPKTDRAAVYYPWVKIPDPLKGGKLRLAPPSGAIAGLYARTDSTRGIWKAPAGTEANLVGVQGVDYVLTDGENGILNPRGVNAVRLLPVVGPVVWGARTLRGDDQLADEYKYIPVRRTALFIEESLYRGTQWVVFEPNDEPLRAQIRLNIGAFMHNLFRQGAFQGKTPKEAYLVKCDRETTTQNDINLGVVNIIVGFAPLKPAEFVVIKIQQLAGQIAS